MFGAWGQQVSNHNRIYVLSGTSKVHLFDQVDSFLMAIRWGICSAGNISHDFVVGLKSLPVSEHQVVAVAASRSLEPATKFAETHSIPRAYGSYQELSKDTEVDVVYVGNLHGQHKTAVLMMIASGKHVLCEKPMTMYSKDTAELIAAAREKNVFLMEALWTRFFPAVVELRKRIVASEIGDVKFVNAHFGFRAPKKSDRLTEPSLGGGALLDVGVYPIHFATMVFGERPESIHTTGWLMGTGVDEAAFLTLRYSGERVAHLACSFNLQLKNEAVVVGTKGILKLPSPFWCPTKLETPSEMLDFPLPEPYLPTNFQNSVGLRYEASAVRECILAGKTESEVAPLDQTQIVADIVESGLQTLGVKY